MRFHNGIAFFYIYEFTLIKIDNIKYSLKVKTKTPYRNKSYPHNQHIKKLFFIFLLKPFLITLLIECFYDKIDRP